MRVQRPCRGSASNAARVEAPQRTRMRLAACPWPQRGDWRRVLQGEAESEGKPCRNACMGANAPCSISGSVGENETPPEGIRGRSRSSEIGATDLPGGRSVRCEAVVESCRAVSGQAQTAFAAIARHRLVMLVDGGVHSAGCRRDVEGMHRSRSAMGAHITPVFFRMQTLFLHPATNGLRRPAHAVTRKRRSGRSRFVG